MGIGRRIPFSFFVISRGVLILECNREVCTRKEGLDRPFSTRSLLLMTIIVMVKIVLPCRFFCRDYDADDNGDGCGDD